MSLDKIFKEYSDSDDDFGFSAVSEADYNAAIDKAVKNAEYEASSLTADQYLSRLKQLEKLIVPFLTKLHTTGDKEYIYWPNRKPIIEEQIEKILKLTRG
jgi:hypothetical protein